jgi:hypothetical protein
MPLPAGLPGHGAPLPAPSGSHPFAVITAQSEKPARNLCGSADVLTDAGHMAGTGERSTEMKPSARWARRVIAGAIFICAGALTVSCDTSSMPRPGPAATVTTPVSSTSTASSGSTATAASARPRPCAASALRATIGPWNGAGTGSYYRPLNFTNISAVRCALYGYPDVSFVTRAGHVQIGGAAGRTPATGQAVVLAPGAMAHARLRILNVLFIGRHACRPTTAHWLRVYFPYRSTARYLAWTAQVCSRSKPSFLSVGPVQPGP